MKKNKHGKGSISQGFIDGMPIALGYLSVSFAFGMLVANAGLPVWVALMISMTNLTSAGQFAGMNSILACAPLIEVAVTQFIINIRYALMSLSLGQKLDSSVKGWQRWLIGFGVTDEIFGVASRKGNRLTPAYFTGLIAGPYFGWALGTLLGACASYLMPQPLRDALGIALYGMFLAIIIPPAKKSGKFALIILCAAALSACLYWIPGLSAIPSGWSVIICAVVAAAVGAVFFPVSEDEEDEKNA